MDEVPPGPSRSSFPKDGVEGSLWETFLVTVTSVWVPLTLTPTRAQG